MTRTAIPKTTQTLDSCRDRIQRIIRQDPRIRLNIALTHTKVVQDAPATIVGAYRHVFCVEENSCGTPQRHTFTYADLLTGRVEVKPVE